MNPLVAVSRHALAVLARNRWVLGVPVATLLLPATVYAVRLPEVYKATAMVEVRPVGPPQTGGVLPQKRDVGTEHTLSTARDRLLANANAAAVVPILFPGARPTDVKWIQGVQARVEYDQAGEAAFKIGIEDTSPKRAADAVNALLDAFVANERASLLQKAVDDAAFAQGNYERATREWQAAYDAVQEFARAHPGTMPEQKESVSSELRSVEAEVRDREAQAASARRLSQQYEELLKKAPQEIRGSQRAQSAEEEQLALQLKGVQQSLDTATKELADAQQRYTAKHPTVQQLSRVADDLRAKVEATKAELAQARRRADEDASLRRQSDQKSFLETIERLRAQVVEDETRAVAAVQERRARAAALQAQLAAMPETERQVREIRRALEQAAESRKNFESTATSAQNLVNAYRGQVAGLIDFQVQQRAVPPVSPSGPKRWKYLLTAVGLGLLVSYALVLLRGRWEEGTVSQPDDLAGLLPGALVVSVPLLGNAGRRWRARLTELSLAAWVLFCVGGSAYALAARKGVVTPPGFLRTLLGGGA